MAWIPKYIRQLETKRPGETIYADLDWNRVHNLLIEQGDYNTETLNTLINYAVPALDDKTNVHIADQVRHITAQERATWNDKPSNATFNAHFNDNVRHITAAERATWNDKPSNAQFNTLVSQTQGFINSTTATLTQLNNDKADKTTVNAHIADTTRHITAQERTLWDDKPSNATFNALKTSHETLVSDVNEFSSIVMQGMTQLNNTKLNITTFDEHVADAVRHVSPADRARWDLGGSSVATINSVPPNASKNIEITGGTGITVTANPASNSLAITATGSATPGPHASSHRIGGSDALPESSEATPGLTKVIKTWFPQSQYSANTTIHPDVLRNSLDSVWGQLEVTTQYTSLGLVATPDSGGDARAITITVPGAQDYNAIADMVIPVRATSTGTNAIHTMNINGWGAKPMVMVNLQGTAFNNAFHTRWVIPNAVYHIMYDAVYDRILVLNTNTPAATIYGGYGVTTLANTMSTSTTLAATPALVKSVDDKIVPATESVAGMVRNLTLYATAVSGSGTSYDVTVDNFTGSELPSNGLAILVFRPHMTSTGSVTIRVNGVSFNGYKNPGTRIGAGDLVDGVSYSVILDRWSSRAQLLNPTIPTYTHAEIYTENTAGASLPVTSVYAGKFIRTTASNAMFLNSGNTGINQWPIGTEFYILGDRVTEATPFRIYASGTNARLFTLGGQVAEVFIKEPYGLATIKWLGSNDWYVRGDVE